MSLLAADSVLATFAHRMVPLHIGQRLRFEEYRRHMERDSALARRFRGEDMGK